MSDTQKQFLDQLKDSSESITFDQTIDLINKNYHYTPARFSNGQDENVALNEAGTNEGSCKIFAFAQLNKLSEQQTLHCFGDYYRKDVLENPNGSDHTNIRNFMESGWSGISFETVALKSK